MLPTEAPIVNACFADETRAVSINATIFDVDTSHIISFQTQRPENVLDATLSAPPDSRYSFPLELERLAIIV